MARDATIKVAYIADTKELSASLKRAESALKDTGDVAERSADRAARALDERARPSLDNVAEGSDTVASKGAQAAGALSGLGDLVGGPVGTAMTTFGIGLQAAADSGDLLNAATDGISKRMLIMSGVALGIVAVLAGVALALKYAYDHSEPFRKAVDRLWSAIKRAGAQIRDALQPYIDRFSRWMQEKGTVLVNKLSVWINTKLVPAIGKIANWIATKLIPKLAEWASWFNKHIMPTLSKVVSFIVSKVIPWFVKLQTHGIGTVISGVRTFVRVISGIVGTVSRVISSVRSRFNSLVSFIRGLPGRIRGFLANIWSGVGSSLRAALNSALSLPLTIPSISVGGVHVGGQTLIPRLAQGGIIKATPGGQLINAGEAGYDEMVIPLDGRHQLGGQNVTININVTAGVGDPVAIGREVAGFIKAYVAAGGRVRIA